MTEQELLFTPIPCNKYDLLTKEEIVALYKDSEDLIAQMQRHIKKLYEKLINEEQKSFLLGEDTINIKHRLFGKSSEKSSKENKGKKKKSSKNRKGKRVKLPSQRYPNVMVIEKDITMEHAPTCPCCNKQMQDSGLTEDSEYLTVIPKRYLIIRQKRHKYRCSCCQGSLVTTPAIPRITPGSVYSDEMILDATLSKYCDLVPMERYTEMAARDGVEGIPANSLIQASHHVADFLEGVYEDIKEEVLESEVIHADETPHRMLEGDDKSRWYMWGFSTDGAAYFENQPTRSGEVAVNFLNESRCKHLVSDVFSGYRKAVTESNKFREERGLKPIKNIYCNAHARRKFKEAHRCGFKQEANYFLWCYRKIYNLEKKKDFKHRRNWQRIYFRIMERLGIEIRSSYSRKSSLGKAINYLLNNFDELTCFLGADHIPIDNNAQERLMRSPVVGRKTWYGTHSKRGAKTNAVIFTLVESCKLNKINPREYFKEVVLAIHQGKQRFTPSEYAAKKKAATV